jgi:PHD/YefM family antitoxin component YafN of YafNO toxin-antitoxin module
MFMISVKATEFAKNFGRYKQLAQREPVEIVSHERPAGYLISPADFEEYRRLRSRQRKAFRISELPADILADILQSEVDPRHAHLDRLLEEPVKTTE